MSHRWFSRSGHGCDSVSGVTTCPLTIQKAPYVAMLDRYERRIRSRPALNRVLRR